jgi:hypothetical protein
MDTLNTTYRVISLSGPELTGKTAATPELAKLVAGDLDRSRLLGMERTDWADNFGKPKACRTVLVDAEDRPGEWELGVPKRSIPKIATVDRRELA